MNESRCTNRKPANADSEFHLMDDDKNKNIYQGLKNTIYNYYIKRVPQKFIKLMSDEFYEDFNVLSVTEKSKNNEVFFETF